MCWGAVLLKQKKNDLRTTCACLAVEESFCDSMPFSL